jgi:hypothetical protein
MLEANEAADKAEFAAWEEASRLGLTGIIATVDSDPTSPVQNCADLVASPGVV